MKTIARARLIIILICSIVVGTVTTAYSQKVPDADYMYLDFSFDGNKLLNIWDNPRTEVDHLGLDWDFEAGARDKRVGVYIFGGMFVEADYMNYGLGADYYLFPNTQGLDLSLGVYYSQVLRQDSNGTWGSFTAWVSPRGRLIYWINDMLGINLTTKGQRRPELGKTVWELSGGLTIKFDR